MQMPDQNMVAIKSALDTTPRPQAVAMGTAKAIDLYKSCMDTEHIDKAGADPILAL